MLTNERRVVNRALGIFALTVSLTALTSSFAWGGVTLDKIKKDGVIKVGVAASPGFSSPDSNGKWQGFFVDFGRALAITVFNDPNKAEFAASSPEQRLPALQSGEYDVLLSGVTQTISRAFKLGFSFGPVIFYDGQGLLVKKSLGVTKGTDLDGATIGVQSGTTGELNIADFFRKTKKTYKPVVIEDSKEFVDALNSGRVDALTQDSSDLAVKRNQLSKPDDFVILPERLSKEPLVPAIRGGDHEWLEIVNWTIYATVQAEEWGITKDNVDTFLTSDDPAIQRFLGVDKSLGEAIGLDPKFAYNIVKTVGNYGEIFERNIGKKTPLGFERGYNNLWTQGGLLYSPPFR
jgi:general L-amino acid transport system substrate-binding protein